MAPTALFEPFVKEYAERALAQAERNDFNGVYAEEWFAQCIQLHENDDPNTRPALCKFSTFKQKIGDWVTNNSSTFASLETPRGYCLTKDKPWCDELIRMFPEVPEIDLYGPLREWLETVGTPYGIPYHGFLTHDDKEGGPGENPDVTGWKCSAGPNATVQDIICIDAKKKLANWPQETGPVLTYYRFANRAYIAYPVLASDPTKIIAGFPLAMIQHLARHGVGILAVHFENDAAIRTRTSKVLVVLPAASSSVNPPRGHALREKCWNVDEPDAARRGLRALTKDAVQKLADRIFVLTDSSVMNFWNAEYTQFLKNSGVKKEVWPFRRVLMYVKECYWVLENA